VVDAELKPVPDGATGEIVIRGPNVMRGYYKNEEATRASFTPDGWLRTGDLGHRDADGFFFVTGRIKELIIKGGENIAPREIDEALLAPGGAGGGGGRHPRPPLRPGHHGLRRAARRQRGRAARLLHDPRALQDAARVPLRRAARSGFCRG
jgi:acyl-CoA synthetase (AMP-forming)/AMP-acid ligase II